jgi:hypothetical protein
MKNLAFRVRLLIHTTFQMLLVLWMEPTSLLHIGLQGMVRIIFVERNSIVWPLLSFLITTKEFNTYMLVFQDLYMIVEYFSIANYGWIRATFFRSKSIYYQIVHSLFLLKLCVHTSSRNLYNLEPPHLTHAWLPFVPKWSIALACWRVGSKVFEDYKSSFVLWKTTSIQSSEFVCVQFYTIVLHDFYVTLWTNVADAGNTNRNSLEDSVPVSFIDEAREK